MMEHASDLRGFLVVAREEGAQLGTLSAIYIDPDTKRVSAFAYRTRRIAGDEFFVPISEVQTVGKNVVLISSEKAAQKIQNGKTPPGRSLKDLQGSWVTTMDGHRLGTLVDLDFTADWKISELSLADDKQLPVETDKIKLGDEIVLVPSQYADRIQENKGAKTGLLGRTFGEAFDDTKKALKRALSKSKKDKSSEMDGPKP